MLPLTGPHFGVINEPNISIRSNDELELSVLNSPAIDPGTIVINAGEPESADTRYDFMVPVASVNQIRQRLEEGGQPHEGSALLSLLAQICLDEAIGRFELDPIWGPFLLPQKESPQPTPEDDFRCSALIDTSPEMTLPEFSDMTLCRPILTIDDEMVEAELEEQRFQLGSVAPSDKPMVRGDQAVVLLNLLLSETGESVATEIESVVRVPRQGQPALFEGLVIDGLAGAIEGMCAGDSVVFDSIVPAALGKADNAGSAAKCSIKIRSVERITPATLDGLVARYESPSEATLRQQVKLSLEHRFSIEQQQYLTNAVFESLLEGFVCPVPRRVITKRIAELKEQSIKAATASGEDETAATKAAESATRRFATEVTRQARRTAIGMMLQRELKIAISEHDVEARIRSMAALRGMRPEEVRKEIVDAGQIDMVAKQVFESKIAAHVLAKATVSDVPAAEVGLRGA